jgi:hypothetical protein
MLVHLSESRAAIGGLVDGTAHPAASPAARATESTLAITGAFSYQW